MISICRMAPPRRATTPLTVRTAMGTARRIPPRQRRTRSGELEEQRDRYLRLAAEYDNYRKRSIKERQEAGTRAQADLVKR